MDDCDKDIQDFINNASFQHYNPWRIVLKEDSILTPVRMVVDPTRTSFNLLLAKGDNRLGYIFDIIVRNRCKQHAWSSDISKLYNQLHLDISVLPQAWYGISSTGGQAGAAVIKLIEMVGKEDLRAVETLEKDRFVDDLLGGVSPQVKGTTNILGRG